MKMYLCWKDVDGNTYNLGLLNKEDKYVFVLNSEEYEKALNNGCAGIGNLARQSNLPSEILFQFFKERIPGKDSPRLNTVLNLFNMKEYDEMELLRKSKGKVATDRFFLIEV